MTAVYEQIRYLNVLLSVGIMVAMLFRGAAFLRAPVASKYGRLALFAWTSWLAYGTLESIVLMVPPGPRVPSATSVLLLTAWWVVQESRYDGRERARLERMAVREPASS